jgi:hypothetical protein
VASQTVIWWENDRKKEKHSQVVQVMGMESEGI